MDHIRREHSQRHHFIGLCDRGGRSHRHQRIEVAGGQRVDEIADVGSAPTRATSALSAGSTRKSRPSTCTTIRPFASHGSETGRCEHAAEARTSCPNALGEVPCGTSSTSISPRASDAVFPDWSVRGNDTGNATGADQLADTHARTCGVIGDHRQIRTPASDQGTDDAVGRTAPMKPPTITVAPSGTSSAAAAGVMALLMMAP